MTCLVRSFSRYVCSVMQTTRLITVQNGLMANVKHRASHVDLLDTVLVKSLDCQAGMPHLLNLAVHGSAKRHTTSNHLDTWYGTYRPLLHQRKMKKETHEILVICERHFLRLPPSATSPNRMQSSSNARQQDTPVPPACLTDLLPLTLNHRHSLQLRAIACPSHSLNPRSMPNDKLILSHITSNSCTIRNSTRKYIIISIHSMRNNTLGTMPTMRTYLSHITDIQVSSILPALPNVIIQHTTNNILVTSMALMSCLITLLLRPGHLRTIICTAIYRLRR